MGRYKKTANLTSAQDRDLVKRADRQEYGRMINALLALRMRKVGALVVERHDGYELLVDGISQSTGLTLFEVNTKLTDLLKEATNGSQL
jgi:hypothetical protein